MELCQENTLSVSGLRIRYFVCGEGIPVLWLHGWGRGCEPYVHTGEMLANAGCRVVIPDLPGFGKSDPPRLARESGEAGPPREVWGIEEYGEFVLRFADAIGFQQFYLLGHSFGGQVGTKLVLAHPERILGLILVAPAAIRRTRPLKRRIIRTIAKIGDAIFSFAFFRPFQTFVKKVFYRMIGTSDYLYTKGIMKEVREKITKQDLSPLLSGVRVPTLLIWGAKDSITPLEQGREMERLIPDSKLQIIPGVGHRVPLEAPAEYSTLVTSFLRKLSGP